MAVIFINGSGGGYSGNTESTELSAKLFDTNMNKVADTDNIVTINYDTNKTYTGVDSLKSKLLQENYKLVMYWEYQSNFKTISVRVAGTPIYIANYTGIGSNRSLGHTLFLKNDSSVAVYYNGSETTYEENSWLTIPSTGTYYSDSTLLNANTSSTATSQRVYVEVEFQDGTIYQRTIATINYLAPTLDKITLDTTNVTRNFYLGETFNYDGLVVNAIYKYQVGQDTYSQQVYGYNVSAPTFSTFAEKDYLYAYYPAVYYSGKTASYRITYAKAQFLYTTLVKPKLKKHIDNPKTCIASSYTIVYGDFWTELQTTTDANYTTIPDITREGTQNLVFSATALKTRETVSSTFEVEVVKASSISITTYPTKRTYTAGETLDTSGIVITADYGDLGTANVTEYAIFSAIDFTKVGEQDITVTYDGLTTTYKIAVSGFYGISADLSGVNDGTTSKFYKGTYLEGYHSEVVSSLQTILSKVKANCVTRTYTYSSDTFSYVETTTSEIATNITFTNTTLVENATKTITASVTLNGKTLSTTFTITTYTFNSLNVTDLPSLVYYNVNNSDWANNIKVYGVKPNNETMLLDSSLYTVSPAINTTLGLGNNTITFISTQNQNAQYSKNINCINDYPKPDTTLTPSGSLNKQINNNKYYYGIGQSIDLSNLNLVVGEMASGTTNVTITSDNYTWELFRVDNNQEIKKNSLIFTNDDVTGAYTLRLSFANLTPVTYNIVLDYVTAVDINLSTTKTVYKNGQALDFSEIKGTKTFASGDTADITESDILSYQYFFEKQDTSNNDSEEVELDFNICGFPKTITFTIICVKSLTITLNKNQYNVHDELDVLSVRVTYSDDTTTSDLLSGGIASLVWTTGGASINAKDLTTSDIRTVYSHTLTATYTEYGISATGTCEISIKALKSIALVDSNSTPYPIVILDYNTLISSIKNNLKIKATFNDNTTTSNLSLNDYQFYSSGNEQITNQKIKDRISNAYTMYRWILNDKEVDSLKCTFDIYCKKLVDLSLSWGSINSTHYVGDTLPINTITNIVATYSAQIDGEEYDADYVNTQNLTYNDEAIEYSFSNGSPIENHTYSFGIAGTYTLVVAYTSNGLRETKTKTITVENVDLQSITVDYRGTDEFIEEQQIVLSDSNLTVTGVYNNGNRPISIDTLNFYEKVNDEYVLFNIGKRLSILDDNKTIYIQYSRYPDVYAELMTISVSTKTLEEIIIVTNPTKVKYTIGDIFSLDGIVVRAVFDNGTTDLIDESHLTASGMVTSRALVSTDITQEETKTITVAYTYGGYTATKTYTVNLEYPTIDYLRISTQYATTIFHDGDTFSSTGLLVYAVYENGYEEQLQTLNTNYTINTSAFVSNTTISVPTNPNSNKKEYGLRTIAVTGVNPHDPSDTKTNETDYKITILGSAEIESVFPRTDDGYNEYIVGDVFTAKGYHYWVHDGDGNEYEVDFDTNPPKNTMLKKAQTLNITAYFSNYQPLTYTINVNSAYEKYKVQTRNYKIAIGDINGALFTSITHAEAEIELGVKENGEITYPIFNADDVVVDTNIIHSATTYGYNIFNDVKANATSKCIGYMEMGVQDDYGNVIKNAHIVLFDDPVNPIVGDGNVVVKYPHYVSGYSDRINKSTFGIIYNKHLFVSGNPDFKNCDWHTENINVAQVDNYNQIAESDYTYFSDLDYCYYGTDDTKVVGYDIYRDGDLVVIKESSRTQATLYRREAKIITAIDSQGNVLNGYYEDAYPSYDINFNGGDGGLSNRSIINFMGDTLFLTKNGLKILSSKDTTYNKEKVVYDVSSYINPRILNENLEDGYLFTFKEKLILRTSRGVYVGEYTLRNDNKEYEWYFLGNIKADLFFEYDNELYFMNNEGAFCKFSSEERKYNDNSRVFIGVGGTLLTNIPNDDDGFEINSENDRIIVSSEYADYIKEGKEFHLITSYENNSQYLKSLIHANVGSFVEKNYRDTQIQSNQSFNKNAYIGIINADTNTIEVKIFNEDGTINTLETMKQNEMIYTNRDVYIDNIPSGTVAVANALAIDTAYRLVKYNTDVFDYRYKIVNARTNVACDLSTINEFRISFIVNELSNTTITDIQSYGSGKSFKLLGEHDKVLDLIYYNNRNDKYSAVITTKEAVQSYFITKPYDMGTILYDKTIYQWAITNDTELASYMDVGFLTSKKQGDYDVVVKTTQDSKSFAFNDSFSFDKIQFTSDKLPHIYNRYRLLANIGFIRFIFKNNEDSNLVLDKLSLIYTISQSIKGER